jgi:hypothetical protein
VSTWAERVREVSLREAVSFLQSQETLLAEDDPRKKSQKNQAEQKNKWRPVPPQPLQKKYPWRRRDHHTVATYKAVHLAFVTMHVA